MDGVVDHVLECGGVLLFGLDHLRPEAPAEDVVGTAVPLVEGPRIAPIQVAHAVGQVRPRRLDDEVIVVAQEAAGVEAPAVAGGDFVQGPQPDGPVVVIQHNRCLVVAARRDVVPSACGEVAAFATHLADRSARGLLSLTSSVFWRRSLTLPSRARHEAGLRETWPRGTAPGGACLGAKALTLEWRLTPRPSTARGAGATGSSRVRAAASAGRACPYASLRGSGRRRRPARRSRSAPR